MRLLIIEDEPKTAAYLQKGLTENGSFRREEDKKTVSGWRRQGLGLES